MGYIPPPPPPLMRPEGNMNCRNCGAASWKQGKCEYCWSLRDTLDDVETVALAYYRGFIGEKERWELMTQLGLLSAGQAVVIPMNADIEFVSSQNPHNPLNLPWTRVG